MSAPYDPNRRGRFFLFHPAFTFDHEEFVVDPSGYLRRWLPQTEGLTVMGAVEEFAREDLTEYHNGDDMVVASEDGTAWKVTVGVRTVYEVTVVGSALPPKAPQ
jgi:hypothetical protein